MKRKGPYAPPTRDNPRAPDCVNGLDRAYALAKETGKPVDASEMNGRYRVYPDGRVKRIS